MRGRAERDEIAGPLEPVRVGRSGTKRAVLRLVWIVAALLLLAVYKPWDTGFKAPPGGAFVPAPAIPASPTPRPSTDLDAVAGFCLEPSGWRVYSSESWGRQGVRSWTALTPIALAAGPADPAIPVTPVVSQQVLAIGFCAPSYGPEKPPSAATARLYRVGSVTVAGERIARAVPIAPTRIEPVGNASSLGAVYAPVDGTSWSDGLYVVRIDAAQYTRWFGIRVEIVRRVTTD